MALTLPECILEQNSQLPTPPKVWISGFPSVDENGKLVSAIMKNQKNGSNSPKMHPRANQCWTCMYKPACVILTLFDMFQTFGQNLNYKP